MKNSSKKAGVMKDCGGLRPSKDGKRVRFDGEARSVVSDNMHESALRGPVELR